MGSAPASQSAGRAPAARAPAGASAVCTGVTLGRGRAPAEPPELAPAPCPGALGLCRTRSTCDTPPRNADSSRRMWGLQKRRHIPLVPHQVWWLPPRTVREGYGGCSRNPECFHLVTFREPHWLGSCCDHRDWCGRVAAPRAVTRGSTTPCCGRSRLHPSTDSRHRCGDGCALGAGSQRSVAMNSTTLLQLIRFRSVERAALLPNQTDRCAMDLVGGQVTQRPD